jgi:histidinol-phosphate/aromatic aminotransferase/cobyric acid decarboxylase-like protein
MCECVNVELLYCVPQPLTVPGGNLQNYIRISSGKPEHIDALVQALKVRTLCL